MLVRVCMFACFYVHICVCAFAFVCKQRRNNKVTMEASSHKTRCGTEAYTPANDKSHI